MREHSVIYTVPSYKDGRPTAITMGHRNGVMMVNRGERSRAECHRRKGAPLTHHPTERPARASFEIPLTIAPGANPRARRAP